MDKRDTVMLVVGAIVISGTVAWNLGALEWLDESHGAISACEAHTLAGLVSPTSYVRRKAEYIPKPALTYDDGFVMRSARSRTGGPSDALSEAYAKAVDYQGPKLAKRSKRGEKLSDIDQNLLDSWLRAEKFRAGDKDRITENLPKDRSAVVTLEYDADNQFGANIRSVAYCRFDALGEDDRFDESDILQAGPVEEYEQTMSELMVQAGEIEIRDSESQ